MIIVTKDDLTVVATHSEEQLDLVINSYRDAKFYIGDKSCLGNDGTEFNKAECELINTESELIKRIESKAFAQQNKIIDQNMAEFLWDMFKNFDLSVCPIASNYKDFMDALWLQYHTDKASLNESFDYSTIVPADDYSYQEIEAEYIANKS
jgi:hypothetical protein